ncbi:MAG: aminotransferase class I/II-fold pyridoxal phosphate-dependent enzyme [Chloroflexota bacterium]|nr:aminotransferase class I/II-fold pyridoxal phosphate-dependent enzyme [Chloroflexota bacterium]
MSDSSQRQALQFDREEMREFGYQVIDSLVDYYESRAEKPVAEKLDLDALDAILTEPLPRAGSHWRAVLEQFERQVVDSSNRVDHPRFFAYIPLANNFVSVMADALAAGYNIFNAVWLQGPGAAQIERLTVDWLRQIFGFPAAAGGTFVSGGSVANLTALAVAREIQLGGDMREAVAYCSDQIHFAVSRGLRLLGFAPGQLRKIPSDENFRLPLEALRAAIAEDRAAGRRPFCVIASAGTTNTGAVDPLDALADLCLDENLWLHVDGAYGAPAVLTPPGAEALKGLERAHSLALDAHKWLFQPIECGVVLLRDRHWLPATFKERAEYLKDVEAEGEEINFMYQGIQLTRQFRALKLWMSFKVFGLDAISEAIAAGFANAELAERLLRAAGCWEIVTPARMAIVTFRYTPANGDQTLADRVTQDLVERLRRDGDAFASGTQLRGKPVMRLCANNPRTTPADLEKTIQLMGRLAAELEVQLAGLPADNQQPAHH